MTLEQRLQRIKLVIFDVDGVMTDGRLIIGDDGLEYKCFNTQDGLGMKLLKATGVDMAIITGRTSKVVTQRAESTGVSYFYQGVDDKLLAFEELLKETGLQPDQCAFMGDDVVDLPPMRRAGLALTVPQAHDLVKQHAHYITTLQAGQGAVREACELIMRMQGTLDSQLAQFLR